MVDTAANRVLSTKEYKVVGTRPIRHDGLDKVTGRARYGRTSSCLAFFTGWC